MLPYSILVKYLPVTDCKGSRLKASCDGKSITIGFDSSLNFDGNADKACLALIKKLGFFKGSLSQYYLTRGTVKEGERVYSFHSHRTRLEIPKY
jgi:hypothetical protein